MQITAERKIRKGVLAVALVGVAASQLAPELRAAQPEPSLEAIVQGHRAALGGEALAKVQTLEIHAEVTAFGSEYRSIEMFRRPHQHRFEAISEGLIKKRALFLDNGRGGSWTGTPDSLHRNYLVEDQPQQHLEQADFEGPLVDWQKKGHQVSLLGKSSVGKQPAWLLEVLLKSKERLHIYLDTATYLPIKVSRFSQFGSSEKVINLFYSDYRWVGGIRYPFYREERGYSSEANTHRIKKVVVDGENVRPELFEGPSGW